jgi:hypothetical protein
MTRAAVVFSGRNGLDRADLRNGVLRIPEVTMRLREAQSILDGLSEFPKVDILSLLTSDDEHFFRNIQLKSLVAAIVQVALFDRYLKTQARPQFFVGNSNGDSAMLVCSGKQTFLEMILRSPAVAANRAPSSEIVVALATASLPVLSGLSLTEYHALESKVTEQGLVYVAVPGDSMELRKLISSLFKEQGLSRFVNVGPSSALAEVEYREIGDGEIEAIDSIELDPLLGWFWRCHPLQALQLAQ